MSRKRQWSKARREHFKATIKARKSNPSWGKELQQEEIGEGLFIKAPEYISYQGYIYQRQTRVIVVS